MNWRLLSFQVSIEYIFEPKHTEEEKKTNWVEILQEEIEIVID